MEWLEARLNLSTVTWTGGGGDLNWNDSANWSGGSGPGGAPGAGDDVTIGNLGVAGLTVSGMGVAIHSLQTASAIDVSGTSFSLAEKSELDAALRVDNGGSVSIEASLNGTGQIVNALGGILTLFGGALNLDVENDGTLLVHGHPNAINGALVTGPASAIDLLSGGWGDASLTVANGFTNHGLIDLTTGGSPVSFAYADFAVTNGTLVNAADGIIRTDDAVGSPGYRELDAVLDNHGLIDLAATSLVVQQYGQSTSEGTINVTAGDLTIRLFNNGDPSSLTNTGTIAVAPGRTVTVNSSSGTFDDSAGKITGPANLVLFQTTTTLDANVALAGLNAYACTVTLLGTGDVSSATTALSLAGVTLNSPGRLVNAAGQTLTMDNDTFNTAVENDGTLLVEEHPNAINGALATGSASAIDLLSGGWGDARLTVANGFTNHGLIDLTTGGSPVSFAYADFAVTNGTLVNAADGIIRTDDAVGSPGYRELDAVLDNHGLIDLAATSLVVQQYGQSTSEGTINVTAGDLTIRMFNNGDPGSLTNTGTIAVAPGRTVTVNSYYSGTFDDSAGKIIGPANLVLNQTTTTLDPNVMLAGLTANACTVTLLGTGDVYLGSLNLDGTLITGDNVVVVGAFNWSYGALQGLGGHGSLTALTGVTLDDTYTVVDFSLINAGQASWTGGTVGFYGTSSFTNIATATFDDQIDGTFGSADGLCQIFYNRGLFLKSGGTGTTNLQMQLYNNGTVRIDKGILNLGCGYVQPPGTPGNIVGPINPPDFTNPGPLPLPPSPTPLTVASYTQTVTGTLIEQIGGLGAGTQYGQIVVNGDVSLDGTLQVALVGGFIPQLTQQFTVISNHGTHSIQGIFTSLPEGSTVWADTYGFTVSYVGGTDHQDLVLTASVVAVKPTLTVNSATIHYDGNPHPAGFTITGVNNDDLSGLVSVTYTDSQNNVATAPPIHAGTYLVTASFPGNASYLPVTATGTITITKADLSITASNANKVYGTPNPTFTVVYAGFVNNETASSLVGTLTFTTSATTSSPVGTYTVTPGGLTSTNYGITYVPGTLTVTTHAGSIYVLDASASAALFLSGNASLKIIGDLVVDSSSSSAISASGNASATAASVQVLGGVSVSGNARVTAPQGKPGFVGDPFAALAAPAGVGPVLSVNLGGNSTQTINPGTYSSIKVSGNARLTLNPGIYVVAGGGISVSGNAGIAGAGVSIYNAGSNVLPGGGAPTYGGIGLTGNGLVQLSAPVTGAYAGVLIFQSRDNTRALSLSGNAALGITGMIYAPKALLSLSGNAQLQSHVPMVVDQLQLSGNGSSSLSTDGSDIAAGELLAGDLSLYIDDPSGYLDSNARARIDDTITHLDDLLVPYSVTVTLSSDVATANLILDTATTSAAGGYTDGVLGCYTNTGEITLIRGWNWFTGSDPASIGADQFDFETIVSHELGHALGLGHSGDPASTMFASLGTNEARRYLTTADLGIHDSDGGPDGLHAQQPDVAKRVVAGIAMRAVASTSDLAPKATDAVASALEHFYQILPTPKSSSASPKTAPRRVAMPSRGRPNWIGDHAVPATVVSRHGRPEPVS